MAGSDVEERGNQSGAAGLLRSTEEVAGKLRRAARRLPALAGAPIEVEFRPELTVAGGKLLSGAGRGTAVHAGAFLKERRLVLDAALLRHPKELERILIHELFHWVWWRLGNGVRREWEEYLAAEMGCRARGELGWSAEWRKKELKPGDVQGRRKKWRAYVCESFCDTAAWLLGPEHAEQTLARRYCVRRAAWMEQHLLRKPRKTEPARALVPSRGPSVLAARGVPFALLRRPLSV